MAITIEDDVCAALIDLHYRTMERAKAKGQTWPESSLGRQQFCVMGLNGEAGEVANDMKKLMRGDDIDADKINREMADTLSYLLMAFYERASDPNLMLRRVLKDYKAKLDKEEEPLHAKTA